MLMYYNDCQQAIRQLKYSKFKHSLLGSVSDDGCVNMWDTNKRCLLHSFSDHHKAPATGLAFSPINEMLVLSVGLDKRIICYDVRGYQYVQNALYIYPEISSCLTCPGSYKFHIYCFNNKNQYFLVK